MPSNSSPLSPAGRAIGRQRCNRTQFNIRDLPAKTAEQIEALTQQFGYTKTQLVIVAIDRLYQQERHTMKHTIVVEFSDDGLWGSSDPEAEGYNAGASANAFENGLAAALKRDYPEAEISVEHGNNDRTSYDGMMDADELTFVDAVVEKYWQSWEWMVKA